MEGFFITYEFYLRDRQLESSPGGEPHQATHIICKNVCNWLDTHHVIADPAIMIVRNGAAQTLGQVGNVEEFV